MINPNLITANLSSVIAEQAKPGVTIWNRLEARPRADNFDRALRAEIRDALWMITRQWQMGEYLGDDAGSAIFAKLRMETQQLHKYQAAEGPVEEFNDAIPLEARVEQLPIPFTLAKQEVSLDIRLLVGRHWLKMIAPLSATAGPEFKAEYPIHIPDPTQPVDASICAHPEAWADFAVAVNQMDGIKFYDHLKRGGAAAAGIPALVGLEGAASALGDNLVIWFEKLFYQPTQTSAWLSDRLEYQFAMATPEGEAEKVYTAEEYFQGHLDWYNFDVDRTRDALGDVVDSEPAAATTLTMLPTHATFNGMPNTRWWAFEDSRTNFGDVKPDTTDLAKLLLIEFGLTFANDWFLIPFTVEAGSVANIKGMAVTNVFGERIWIEPAGRGADDDWQRWAMFLNSTEGRGHQAADLSLLIPPTAQKVLEAPLEEIMFARDEMANMAWGVERTIPLPSGASKRGREAAEEMRGFFARKIGAVPAVIPAAPGAKIRYRVMTSVPENWVPMIPVHVADDNRETQLQRAAMLRIIEGDPAAPVPVEPRTSLLRHGLDEDPPTSYFLHEEEIPRAGVLVTQGFQRTRWRDGRAWLWLGARKRTGRGEGSSGLAFDQIIDLPRTS